MGWLTPIVPVLRQVGWLTPTVPALRRLKQKDQKSQDSLRYIVSLIPSSATLEKREDGGGKGGREERERKREWP